MIIAAGVVGYLTIGCLLAGLGFRIAAKRGTDSLDTYRDWAPMIPAGWPIALLLVLAMPIGMGIAWFVGKIAGEAYDK